MASIAALDCNALCEIASYLVVHEFKNFLSACRRFSACRNDLRTVVQVLINDAPKKRKQWLKSIAARNAVMPVLLYIGRHLGYADSAKICNSLMIRDIAEDKLIHVFDQLLSQHEKSKYLLSYCASTAVPPPDYRGSRLCPVDRSEMVMCMRKLLGTWHLSHETLAKLISDISDLNLKWSPDGKFYAPLRFLCDGTLPPDDKSLTFLIEYFVELERIDDVVAVMPRMSEQLRTLFLLNEASQLRRLMFGINKNPIRMCVYESLSASLSDENRARALLVAATNNDYALVERIAEDMQEHVAIKSLIMDSVKTGLINLYNRYIDRWHPTASEIAELASYYGENLGSRDTHTQERFVAIFLGEPTGTRESSWIEIAADLLRRNFVDRKSLFSKLIEIFHRLKVDPTREDPVMRLFKAAKTVDEIESFGNSEFVFTRQSVDGAFSNLISAYCGDVHEESQESEVTFTSLQVFFDYYKPSESVLLDGIWKLYQSGRFEVLDLLRDRRYFIFDIVRKKQISNREFKERLAEQANPYTMDYLLLDAVLCGDSGCVRIKLLLEQEQAPSQEMIDEAFKTVVQRKSLECIKAFLLATKNRPSINLVRELIGPDHSLYALI